MYEEDFHSKCLRNWNINSKENFRNKNTWRKKYTGVDFQIIQYIKSFSYKPLIQNLMGRYRLGELGIGGRIILKDISEHFVRM
jgi:hypothetical protein